MPPTNERDNRVMIRILPCGIARTLILPLLAVSALFSAPAEAQRKAAKPAAAKQKAAIHKAPPTGPLKSFVETLPGSLVKVAMQPIPAGSINIRGQQVAIKPFWIAKTETAWEAFDAFVASGPASVAYDQTEYPVDAIARPSKSYILPDLGWGHNGYPAINIANITAQMFCRWLSKATGKKYRLPSEAEWEFACRAGASGPVLLTGPLLEKSAWYEANSDMIAHPVGTKQANAWGLHDMYGNPGEWATDVTGKQILCGGTFRDGARQMKSESRKRQTPRWQETDPQLPKSRWWLSDAGFVSFRIVCEP